MNFAARKKNLQIFSSLAYVPCSNERHTRKLFITNQPPPLMQPLTVYHTEFDPCACIYYTFNAFIGSTVHWSAVVFYVAGSHRRFRKFCMHVQKTIKSSAEHVETDYIDNNKNGVMSDKSDKSSPSSWTDGGREGSLAGHSTENLLESDESIDCWTKRLVC